MAKYKYLTMVQIDTLLKCYYLRKYTKVAEAGNITVSQVKHIKENALRTIRLAYSKSHKQGLRFDGETVLQQMAERCGMETIDLENIFTIAILEGLTSESGKYWGRIKRKGNVPTAAELLDFIYDKFEVDIEDSIW